MSSIEELSDEILEEILSYLPGKSMLMLTTVSTRFNDVISSSVKLLNHFEVQWSSNTNLDLRPLLNSTRKYRNLRLYDVTALKYNLNQFIVNHRTTLKSIHLFDCKFNASEIQSILDLVSANLEDLNICEINIEADVEVQPISLPKLKDLELMYGRDSGFVAIIKAFEGAQVERFQYEDSFEMSSQEMEIFESFLLSQKKLRQLYLSCNVTEHLFESPTFASRVQFKAREIFTWMMKTMNDNHYKNLSLFLESQRESVEILTLARCKIERPIMDTLLSLGRLKDVRLVQNDFSWTGNLFMENNSVERMFISLQDTTDDRTICQVLQSFSKVKELKFSCVNFTFDISMVMAYEMKQLTSIDYFNCKFEPITFPNLKKVSFSSCNIEDVLRQILVNRHSLREVVVPYHYSQEARFLSTVIDAHIRSIIFDSLV